MIGRFAILLVAAALVAAVHAPAPEAKTRISVDGTTVTFTVPINFVVFFEFDFDGATNEFSTDPETMEMAETFAAEWEQWAEDYWNAGLARYRYRGCLDIRIDVETMVSPAGARGERSRDGYHDILMSDPTSGIAGNPSPFFNSYTDYEDGSPPTEDSTAPLLGPVFGDWGVTQLGTPRNIAHELAHLLGLGDDYDARTGNPLPGREGTLLDNGDMIDQALVNRLGDLADQVEDLPECWEGTMRSETKRTYLNPENAGQACTDTWESELAFAVDEEGAVEGEGEASLAAGPECQFPAGHAFTPAKKVLFTVEGEADEAALTLRLGAIRTVPAAGASLAAFHSIVVTNAGTVDAKPPGPAFEVPKLDSCTAEGEFTVRGSVIPFGDPTVATSTIELRCPERAAG